MKKIPLFQSQIDDIITNLNDGNFHDDISDVYYTNEFDKTTYFSLHLLETDPIYIVYGHNYRHGDEETFPTYTHKISVSKLNFIAVETKDSFKLFLDSDVFTIPRDPNLILHNAFKANLEKCNFWIKESYFKREVKDLQDWLDIEIKDYLESAIPNVNFVVIGEQLYFYHNHLQELLDELGIPDADESNYSLLSRSQAFDFLIEADCFRPEGWAF